MALRFFLLTTLTLVPLCQTGDVGELYPCHTGITEVVYSNDSDTVVVALNDSYCGQPGTPKVGALVLSTGCMRTIVYVFILCDDNNDTHMYAVPAPVAALVLP